jgi:formate dehydrogenase assembly factor FdhD
MEIIHKQIEQLNKEANKIEKMEREIIFLNECKKCMETQLQKKRECSNLKGYNGFNCHFVDKKIANIMKEIENKILKKIVNVIKNEKNKT